MHRFTTLAKKHEGTTTRESRDARSTNAGYPRGTITSQVCFGFLLSLPERVQRAVTLSPPCPLSERATLRLGLVTGTLLLLTVRFQLLPTMHRSVFRNHLWGC